MSMDKDKSAAGGQQEMCDRCGQRKREYKCNGCDFVLCSECYKILHPPSRKGHIPLPLDPSNDGGDKKTWCQKHNPNPLEYVCLDTMECACCMCLTENEHANFVPFDRFPDYLDGELKRMCREFKEIKEITENCDKVADSNSEWGKSVEDQFKILRDSIKKSKELELKELEKTRSEIDNDLKEKEGSFQRFIQLWEFVNEQRESQDKISPIKLCGAMAEIEKLYKTINLNSISSIIEINDGGMHSEIAKLIDSFGTVGQATRIREDPIPMCSYDGFIAVHRNFITSAATKLKNWERAGYPFKGMEYKKISEECPVLKETEKWIEGLPFMCMCSRASFFKAIKLRAIYDVFIFLLVFVSHSIYLFLSFLYRKERLR